MLFSFPLTSLNLLNLIPSSFFFLSRFLRMLHICFYSTFSSFLVFLSLYLLLNHYFKEVMTQPFSWWEFSWLYLLDLILIFLFFLCVQQPILVSLPLTFLVFSSFWLFPPQLISFLSVFSLTFIKSSIGSSFHNPFWLYYFQIVHHLISTFLI